MAVGDLITAARYNNAQGRVSAILGNGSGNEGYGQTVTSQQVSSNVVIDATHVNDMFTDLNKIFVQEQEINLVKFVMICQSIVTAAQESIFQKCHHVSLFA